MKSIMLTAVVLLGLLFNCATADAVVPVGLNQGDAIVAVDYVTDGNSTETVFATFLFGITEQVDIHVALPAPVLEIDGENTDVDTVELGIGLNIFDYAELDKYFSVDVDVVLGITDAVGDELIYDAEVALVLFHQTGRIAIYGGPGVAVSDDDIGYLVEDIEDLTPFCFIGGIYGIRDNVAVRAEYRIQQDDDLTSIGLLVGF
jgi:hypothetical protein